MEYLICLSASFFCYLFVPISIRLAKRVGLIDQPDKGIHSLPTPRSGGLAVLGAGFLSLLLILLMDTSHPLYPYDKARIYFIFTFLGVFLLGLVDDIWSLKGRHKLIVLFFLSLFFCFYLSLPLSFSSCIFKFLLGCLLFVGTINAINIIDGMDGLSSSLCSLSFLTLFLILSYIGDKTFSFLSLSFSSALLGFLYYNWHPAKIFIGDVGNFTLGFLLAFLCYRLWFASPNVHTLLAILLLLWVPAYDLFLILLIRVLHHRPLLSRDWENAYIKLWKEKGWAYTQVVGFFIMVQAFTCIFSFIVVYFQSLLVTIVIGIFVLTFTIIFTKHYHLLQTRKTPLIDTSNNKGN